MKIGLVDVDGLGRTRTHGGSSFPNFALMKISAYHKSRRDEVVWANPMEHYDTLYMSKVFNFSPDDLYIYDADKIVKGGTGYDIASRLPAEIERIQPDYSIYPDIDKDTAYGFLTRGCPNKCKWCVVPKKEGAIRPYMDIDEVANGRKKVILMDNNILAAGDYCREQLHKIIERGYKVDFNQALDARLVTEEYARLLAQIKWLDRRIRFGCDTPVQIKECERAMALINGYGFKGEYFLYTMLNDDFEESYSRVHYWWERNKKMRENREGNIVYPYAQPYRSPISVTFTPPTWQRDIARWCNNRALFESIKFGDYEPRKGFKCSDYFDTTMAERYGSVVQQASILLDL